MCWPETDTFNNNVILWGREGSWQPQNVRYTVCITPVPVSQCIIKYTTHHHNICIEASEGIIHEATCQVMISSKQNRHNISVPRNLIFYNFVTMMGEAETVGVAQTVWRWYSGWGAMEESPESGEWWHWLAPVITNFLWRRICCQAQMDLSLFQVNSKQQRMGNPSATLLGEKTSHLNLQS